MNLGKLSASFLGALLLAGCAQPPAADHTTTIRYEEGPQVEIVSPAGVRVLIDILNPSLLTQPASGGDVLLTTDMHNPIDTAFAQSFPGLQLMTRAGALTQGDVTVLGIASTIDDRQPMQPENGSNYIYVVETGGLRIVHFGIIGQSTLTPEQLAALGRVDVALVPLSYPFSGVNAENRKAFALMDQVEPRLVVPTQLDEATARYASERWVGVYAARPALVLQPSTLPERTTVVFAGALGRPMGELLHLPALPEPLEP